MSFNLRLHPVVFLPFLLTTLMDMSAEKLITVNFEVYGTVQGVFFRKHTQQQAKLLGLRGYCMNTEHGTVQGRLQGVPDKIEQMKRWLKEVGSPSSKIDKAVFSNEQEIKKFTDSSFIIQR